MQKNTTEITNIMHQLGRQAVKAASQLATVSTAIKNQVLTYLAENLDAHRKQLMLANQLDQANAKELGLSPAMIDRLVLNQSRIDEMIKSVLAISNLDDPVGRNLAQWDRPNQLIISRVSVPFGVIGIIYESRPNVTIDAAALCIKSGNAAILRAGSDCFYSSTFLAELIGKSLVSAGLSKGAVQLVPTKDREAVSIMLKMKDYIDLIIPRGGNSLTKLVDEKSNIPTLLHLTGNCHSYIHSDADPELARKVLLNAKMRRTGICGATESLVIDHKIAYNLLKLLVDDLLSAGCEVRGDRPAQAIDHRILLASDEDFGTEYLAPIISVKLVDNLEEAIEHINIYGSHHTDAILTEDNEAAEKFLAGVNSAIVIHNASTQFADGGEFGMGAEIGIATGKLHARGPVGLEQLTTYKYVVRGNGQVRG